MKHLHDVTSATTAVRLLSCLSFFRHCSHAGCCQKLWTLSCPVSMYCLTSMPNKGHMEGNLHQNHSIQSQSFCIRTLSVYQGGVCLQLENELDFELKSEECWLISDPPMTNLPYCAPPKPQADHLLLQPSASSAALRCDTLKSSCIDLQMIKLTRNVLCVPKPLVFFPFLPLVFSRTLGTPVAQMCVVLHRQDSEVGTVGC